MPEAELRTEPRPDRGAPARLPTHVPEIDRFERDLLEAKRIELAPAYRRLEELSQTPADSRRNFREIQRLTQGIEQTLQLRDVERATVADYVAEHGHLPSIPRDIPALRTRLAEISRDPERVATLANSYNQMARNDRSGAVPVTGAGEPHMPETRDPLARPPRHDSREAYEARVARRDHGDARRVIESGDFRAVIPRPVAGGISPETAALLTVSGSSPTAAELLPEARARIAAPGPNAPLTTGRRMTEVSETLIGELRRQPSADTERALVIRRDLGIINAVFTAERTELTRENDARLAPHGIPAHKPAVTGGGPLLAPAVQARMTAGEISPALFYPGGDTTAAPLVGHAYYERLEDLADHRHRLENSLNTLQTRQARERDPRAILMAEREVTALRGRIDTDRQGMENQVRGLHQTETEMLRYLDESVRLGLITQDQLRTLDYQAAQEVLKRYFEHTFAHTAANSPERRELAATLLRFNPSLDATQLNQIRTGATWDPLWVTAPAGRRMGL